ncbi:MAG: hypothetical protein WA136_02070 [Rhodoferax sp.]
MNTRTPTLRNLLAAASLALLGACSSTPQPPDWQVEAKGSMERAVAAYLEGNNRVEIAELQRAHNQLARTGRADLLATAELLRCATRVASLVFEPCTGFEALRADALEAQRAYADYLQGRLSPQGIALLPPLQRAAATGDTSAVLGAAEPLSQLVAAGVMLQAGTATPTVIARAIETASAQGWRRPLLAWLGVQAQRAEQAGDPEEAARLRRRIALTQGSAPRAPDTGKTTP